VEREALELAREKYLALCASHSHFRIVDAAQPLEEVVGEVVELMVDG